MPDGWAWSRLEPIASLITDYVANGSFASLKANVRTYKEKNYALFVRTVDFANNFKGDLSYIDKESYDFLEKSKLYGGELMLSNIGAYTSTLPCGLVPKGGFANITSNILSEVSSNES